jgi:hypothetical protein
VEKGEKKQKRGRTTPKMVGHDKFGLFMEDVFVQG